MRRDTGIVVYGSTYEDLFGNAASALFSVIFDMRRVRKAEVRAFSLDDGDDALVVFLNELLYLWDTGRFIPKTARITKDGSTLRVALQGESFDPLRHAAAREIKAATYHGFSLKSSENGFEARVILDL